MMNSVAENLKAYFKNTPKEQIDSDWAATQKYDEIGPSVKEFLSQTELIYKYVLPEDYWEFNFSSLQGNIENPEVTSDFFLY